MTSPAVKGEHFVFFLGFFKLFSFFSFFHRGWTMMDDDDDGWVLYLTPTGEIHLVQLELVEITPADKVTEISVFQFVPLRHVVRELLDVDVCVEGPGCTGRGSHIGLTSKPFHTFMNRRTSRRRNV